MIHSVDILFLVLLVGCSGRAMAVIGMNTLVTVALRRAAILTRRLAALLGLAALGFGLLQQTLPLLLLSAELLVLDLILPNESHGRLAEDPLVLAELADPEVFRLGWIVSQLVLGVATPVLGRSRQLSLATAPTALPLGGGMTIAAAGRRAVVVDIAAGMLVIGTLSRHVGVLGSPSHVRRKNRVRSRPLCAGNLRITGKSEL